MNVKFTGAKKGSAFLWGWVCVLFLMGCSKEDDGPKEDVNSWIYKTMESYYLWNEEIPEKANLDFSQSPDNFFRSLLSDQDGKLDFKGQRLLFSTIENKETTKAIDGTDSYGFDFVPYSVNQNSFYWCLVLYVYPGSPAAEAGLQRGDWINGLNGRVNNITDYSALKKGASAVFTLARYDADKKGLTFTRTIEVQSSRPVEKNPFLKDSVYYFDEIGKRVGYLVYNSFTSGPEGQKDLYDTRMRQLFTRFKSAAVNEFILDLRYNGGGLVSSAQLLASFLAPSNALGKVFCQTEYNKNHTDENVATLFKKSSEVSNANLNLQRLYVLVDEYTASASELVINSLIPYMNRDNITLIGLRTLGKTVGSRAFGEKEGHGWILHPIIFRIYNADHTADYGNGFEPDVYLDELEFGANVQPYGNVKDACLNKALTLITGRTFKSTSPASSVSEDVCPLRPSFVRGDWGWLFDKGTAE